MTSPYPHFTCPRCGRTSHHPKDVQYGYCAACHDYTGTERTESHDTAEASYIHTSGRTGEQR